MILSKDLLVQLAETRLAEAEHLLNAGYFSGAYYLGGYAVELGLKACIAEAFQAQIIPDKRFVERIYTHDLVRLVDLAGLDADLEERLVTDFHFAEHWRDVARWSESARYSFVEEVAARSFIDALVDKNHGVFQWIRSAW